MPKAFLEPPVYVTTDRYPTFELERNLERSVNIGVVTKGCSSQRVGASHCKMRGRDFLRHQSSKTHVEVNRCFILHLCGSLSAQL